MKGEIVAVKEEGEKEKKSLFCKLAELQDELEEEQNFRKSTQKKLRTVEKEMEELKNERENQKYWEEEKVCISLSLSFILFISLSFFLSFSCTEFQKACFKNVVQV